MAITLDQVRAAVALADFDDEAARDIMGAKPRPVRPTKPWRPGSVLILLHPGDEGLVFPITRRTDHVEHHRGQLSFPGGARENGETALEAALREAEEEVAVDPGAVEVIGELAPFRIPPSAFLVSPFVATTDARPDYRPDPREVAEVIEVPLDLLLDPDRRGIQERNFHGSPALIPFYDVPGVGDPPLWGATAMMLSGLVERLRAVAG